MGRFVGRNRLKLWDIKEVICFYELFLVLLRCGASMSTGLSLKSKSFGFRSAPLSARSRKERGPVIQMAIKLKHECLMDISSKALLAFGIKIK